MLPVVHLICAARPNFMKIAPLWHALKDADFCRPRLIHTGQHYDFDMSDAFFRDLGLPSPDAHLGIRAGSHARQTGATMIAYEAEVLRDRPGLAIVVGDVNATLACAITAKKLGVTVAHLEAGLRSRDRTMPEEINRIATDSISDILWTPSEDADENLRREGHPGESIRCVGNIMIDSFEMQRRSIEAAPGAATYGLAKGGYAIVTLHRPKNVDTAAALGKLCDALVSIARRLPLIFPVHPRTRARLSEFGLAARLEAEPGLRLLSPVGYIDFMALLLKARFVLTDSGGVQEESTYLDIPCLTLRDTTERPVTVTQGSNRLVSIEGLPQAVDNVLAGRWTHARPPANWDGKTALRVRADIHALLGSAP
ncbi:MAG: UDP-N-acetylglucosamine 2-epimerase (non-hydrolyzing) [Proteobacteria bacterium]|nr:UDP-N-acetylglucosamine 2-epimerase (non-hydrolyzing) [Pseudomonadota bacterium]